MHPASASETGQPGEWNQSYGFDPYGNRWVPTSTGYMLSTYTPTSSTNFDKGNHLAIAGVVYDNAGNLTQLGAGLTFAYDADGRMQASTLNGLTTTYGYDADGHRVFKETGSSITTYLYDVFGNLAAEAGTVAPSSCTRCYLAVDHLGSTRQTTDAAGNVVNCHDYLPFGEELNGVAGRSGGCWSGSDTTLKFTGKERDAETVGSGNPGGLDYFGARYMSSAQGRFTSPDPHTGSLLHVLNPQRWNMYAYAVNNPLSYVDPNGRDAIAVNFGNLAVGAGHWAIISVGHDGSATFSEFGPRGGAKPVYPGQYTSYDLATKISEPTPETLATVQKELAQHEGQPQGSISLAYYKTSDAETASLNAYIQAARQAQAKGNAPFYVVGFNDCRDYCLAGLHAAGITTSHYANLSLAPNFLFQFLESTANTTYPSPPKKKEKIDTTICYEGQSGCSVQQ